jgi:protein O-mannosyl-transferase
MDKVKGKKPAGNTPPPLLQEGVSKLQPAGRQHIFFLAVIAVIIWLGFKNAIDNQFTNWDDPGYINDNPLIKDLSIGGLKKIFSSPVMGNYHPLTMLSYAIEYSFVKLDPWLYHLDNLLLHLAGSLLVYWFVYLLTGRGAVAFIAALLFGIHPMHTESVAWVSGRKDVLYGLFYIASCIAYLCYLRAPKNKGGYYALMTILFICSLLSKAVAVTLPVTLVLIDYFKQRDWRKNIFPEKIPLLAVSVVFGIIAIRVQHNAGAMGMQTAHFNVAERITLGCYALVTYLWKVVMPVNLCCFYPYPAKAGGIFPWYYYLYIPALAAVVFVSWKYLRKNGLVVFGLLFFLANIALLLQFIEVGEAIVADRYSYVAYTGLFIIAGMAGADILQGKARKQLSYSASAVCLVYIGWLAYLSNQRSKDWYDPITLWTADIKHEQELSPNACNNLGFIYYTKWASATEPGEKGIYYDSALYLLNRAVAIRPDFVNPYISLGEIQRSAGHYDEAKGNYYKALKLKPRDGNLYLGLAILYLITKNNDSSDYCFRMALACNPSAEAHGNYANFLEITNMNDAALAEYNTAISMNREMYSLFLNRGKLFKKINRWDDALKDFDTAIRLNPDLGELYYERSFCYARQGDKARALQEVKKAISLSYTRIDDNYYEGLKKNR